MQRGPPSASPRGPRGSSCLLARTIPVPSADRLRPRFLVGVRNTPAHVYQTWHTPQTPKCLSLPFYRRKLRLSEEQSLSQENGRVKTPALAPPACGPQSAPSSRPLPLASAAGAPWAGARQGEKMGFPRREGIFFSHELPTLDLPWKAL